MIIIGGGVARLTLDKGLEQSDIDYTLLQAHVVIAHEVEASIGLFLNGLRIIDQFGYIIITLTTLLKIYFATDDLLHVPS